MNSTTPTASSPSPATRKTPRPNSANPPARTPYEHRTQQPPPHQPTRPASPTGYRPRRRRGDRNRKAQTLDTSKSRPQPNHQKALLPYLHTPPTHPHDRTPMTNQNAQHHHTTAPRQPALHRDTDQLPHDHTATPDNPPVVTRGNAQCGNRRRRPGRSGGRGAAQRPGNSDDHQVVQGVVQADETEVSDGAQPVGTQLHELSGRPD